MPISFPSSPSVNDTYTINGRTFIWNGAKWKRLKPRLTPALPTIDVSNDFSAGNVLHVDSTTGRVGIGTASPLVDLHVDGNVEFTGTLDVSGVVTAPTAVSSTNDTTVATTAYVTTAISDLIGGAPAALDTLNELAAALNDDASYATTITNALAGKLDLSGGSLSGTLNATSIVATTGIDSAHFTKSISGAFITIREWSADNKWLAVEGANGYLLLDGDYADDDIYLRSFNNSGRVNLGAGGSNTLQIDNGSMTLNGTLYSTGRIYPQNWIQFDEYEGLYSPLNAAHFYPNNGSYGSWRVAGTRGNWAGLEFDNPNGLGNCSLMMGAAGSNNFGVHRNNTGWLYYFSYQDLYCNSYQGFNNVGGTGNASWHPSGIYSAGSNWIYGNVHRNGGYTYSENNYNMTSRGLGIAYPDVTVGGGSANWIGFRWSNPNVKATVDNVLNVTVGTASDERLKTNIETLDDGLDIVRQLRPVSFNPLDVQGWDEDGTLLIGDNDPYDTNIGFIAQEVEQILPTAVDGEGDAYKSIQVNQIVAAVVSALQNIDQRLSALEVTNA